MSEDRGIRENFYQCYEKWLAFKDMDPEIRKELLSLHGNTAELKDRFGAELTFGTGGMRGKIGAGSNRMNSYVVRKATQCLANYIKEQCADAGVVGARASARASVDKNESVGKSESESAGKSESESVGKSESEGEQRCTVAIAYDTRYRSREFAEETALVFAANGIKALMFDGVRPTPELSFALRELGCAAGVVITASHNPPEYNGYKVYGPDGGQAVSPLIDYLAEAAAIVDIFEGVRTVSREEAVELGLLAFIDPRIDRLYKEKIFSLSLTGKAIPETKSGKKLKVVFTPMHGTGACFIPDILEQTNYIDLTVVEEQMMPDPSFPTVKVPNPEEIDSFEMALDLARHQSADIVMATDPDADRVGCAVRNEEGHYRLLTGNQIGALLLEYLLERMQEKGTLPANGVIIKTIVTGDLGSMVAASYGIETVETLTGFKYIGEKIKEYEETSSHSFLFGYEESYGYLTGTFVRDKDAMIASFLIAEASAYYKERGVDLLQVLEGLFQRYGYYKEELISLALKDEEEREKFSRVFERQLPEVAGMKLMEKRDYSLGKYWDMTDDSVFEKKLGLPLSKVLYYKYTDNSWFCVRPSGTEPKIKIYFSVVAASSKEAEVKLERLKKAVLSMI